MARLRLPGAAALAAFAALLVAASSPARHVKEGGTFKVAVWPGRVDTIDPALVNFLPEEAVLDPACARLIAYPDEPAPANSRLTPDLAEALPLASRNGLTYTFTIRKDARFSTGAAVTPHAFEHALERIFTPTMKSDSAQGFIEILGARKMLAGKATTLAGATARGRRLTLRLTEPTPTLLDALTHLCAVPPNLPADPEGAKAPLPSAAPYYVAEYVPGERLVLERNRFYSGARPHHIARFVDNLAVDQGSAVDKVASGAFDAVIPGPPGEDQAELAKRYGVNRSQFFALPGTSLRSFWLNYHRPLFRNNVKLRQAVNLAVDRQALARALGRPYDTPTDQYMLPSVSGYVDEDIYPLKGPDLRRAKALGKGHTRGGKAVLYTIDDPTDLARAQILKQNLKAIGLQLEVRAFPVDAYFQQLAPEAPWDFARVNSATGRDPSYLNDWFFDLPKYNRLLDRAARLTGAARYRAYGRLDVQISRDAAPWIPVAAANAVAFVSARTGCVVVNQLLDLTAVCLK